MLDRALRQFEFTQHILDPVRDWPIQTAIKSVCVIGDMHNTYIIQ